MRYQDVGGNTCMMIKTWKLLLEYFLKAAILIFVGYIILNAKINYVGFSQSISNILTVSSIITGIVFAYIINKLFSIKANKEKRQEAIIKLSDKLTNFRRLCYQLLHHNYFWKDKSDINRFKSIYPLYNFSDIHDQTSEDPKKIDFWTKDQGFSTTRADLYLALEQIIDIHDGKDFWIFNRTSEFSYTSDEIAEYYDPTNQIWYYLDYKWFKYSKGVFDDGSLENGYETPIILELIKRIYEDYQGEKLDRKLLAKVASDFQGKYLVELYQLTEKNKEDIPTNVKGLLWTQMFILTFGVLLPLVLSTFVLNQNLQIYLLKISLLIVSEGLLLYLMQLFDFSRQEIKT